MTRTPTRLLGLLALLALIPVAVYLLAESRTVAVLALVNVCLITAALYFFFGPGQSGDTAGH